MTTNEALIAEARRASMKRAVGAPWPGASTGEVDAYRKSWNQAMPFVTRLADALEATTRELDETLGHAREDGREHMRLELEIHRLKAKIAKVRELADSHNVPDALEAIIESADLYAILDADSTPETPETPPMDKADDGAPEPADEEREALVKVIEGQEGPYFDPSGGIAEDIADALLAAGFRRAPIEDAEPVAYEVQTLDGTYYGLWSTSGITDEDREDFILIPLYRAPQTAKPIEVSDSMVEEGCRAFYDGAQGITSWKRMAVVDPETADRYRDGIHAAIEAALKEMGKWQAR